MKTTFVFREVDADHRRGQPSFGRPTFALNTHLAPH
jgi:hypothetical protein